MHGVDLIDSLSFSDPNQGCDIRKPKALQVSVLSDHVSVLLESARNSALDFVAMKLL